jgi:hypothetical protein
MTNSIKEPYAEDEGRQHAWQFHVAAHVDSDGEFKDTLYRHCSRCGCVEDAFPESSVAGWDEVVRPAVFSNLEQGKPIPAAWCGRYQAEWDGVKGEFVGVFPPVELTA